MITYLIYTLANIQLLSITLLLLKPSRDVLPSNLFRSQQQKFLLFYLELQLLEPTLSLDCLTVKCIDKKPPTKTLMW